MPIKTWSELGFTQYGDSENSPFSGFKDIQFYQTMDTDDDGNVITDQISEGLTTLKTDKMSEAEKQELIGKLNIGQLQSGDIGGIINLVSGQIQSKNFVTGSTGWQITHDGTLEANTGTFRGDLIAGSIHIPDQDTTANSFHVSSTGDIWLGATETNKANAPFKVTEAGVLTLTGDGSSISIVNGANTIGFTPSGTNAIFSGTTGSPQFKVTPAGVVTASNITITGGDISGTPLSSIPNNSSTDISLLEKNHDIVFSVTDADTIAWATGTINLSNGRTFSIDAGNTGNMVALTYIYLDPAVSTTVLQTTTTYSTAIGANKVLLGTAQNNTVTASFIPYGPGQPLIDGSNIGALSIVAGNIAASTITAGKLSVSQLSAIAADIGTITAGSISVVSGGNTIGFTPSGTNAIFSGTTGSPQFKVTPAGVLTATGATINGSITSTSGTIGGFTLGSTTLTATNIVLDSGNQKIKAGGANDYIEMISGTDTGALEAYVGGTKILSIGVVSGSDTNWFTNLLIGNPETSYPNASWESSAGPPDVAILTVRNSGINASAFYFDYTGVLYADALTSADLGKSGTEWDQGFINKILGNSGNNVIDFGLTGRIATNQNFTFANITSENPTPPGGAGTVHWNSSTGTLRVYDGSNWRSIDMT